MTTLRQISGVLPPEQPWGLWLSRQIVSGIMEAFGPSLAGARIEPVDVHHDGRRVVGEWVRAPGVPAGTGAIYFVHGSGFALCSPRTHRRLTSWLSRLTGLPVFAVDYRLAPRHRFPTAADDVRAGWDWLTSQVPPDRVVIAGDSAGGHLSVDLLLQPDVAANGPAALALFSPLIDLTLELARAREDLRRLAVDIRAGGARCTLQVWPDQVHVFQALPRLSPEAVKAMKHVARFIDTSMRDNGIEAISGKAG
jgi:acetyl esterase/lipase